MLKRMVFIITSVVVLGIFSANCLADGVEGQGVPFIPQVLSVLPGEVIFYIQIGNQTEPVGFCTRTTAEDNGGDWLLRVHVTAEDNGGDWLLR